MMVPPLLGSGLQRPPALCECCTASGYGMPTVMDGYYYHHYLFSRDFGLHAAQHVGDTGLYTINSTLLACI